MGRIGLIGLATLILAAGCATPAMQSGAKGGIRLENAWARRAPAMAHGASGGHGMPAAGGAANGAVYVTIVNPGGSPDALVKATTDAATTVELHETVQEAGVMKMRPMPRFEVPGGARLEMKPGGHHIMLMGLKRDLKPGDTVHVTLTFDKAGQMTVDAPVR
jgi:copper(I)-binding protein